MIPERIKNIYLYILCKKEQVSLRALVDFMLIEENVIFADKYFYGELRKNVMDSQIGDLLFRHYSGAAKNLTTNKPKEYKKPVGKIRRE